MQALASKLEATSGITDLVGSGASGRIYPVVLRQGTGYPAIRFVRIDSPRGSMLDADTGLVWPRVQIDSYGETYASAAAVAAAVRAALKRQAWTQDSVEVEDALLEQEDDTYEGDVRKYRIRQDYVFCYRE